MRYEKLHPNPEHHHHHLVCDDCGGVVPFEDDELERAIHSFAERATFDVSDHELVLHGHCGSCRS